MRQELVLIFLYGRKNIPSEVHYCKPPSPNPIRVGVILFIHFKVGGEGVFLIAVPLLACRWYLPNRRNLQPRKTYATLKLNKPLAVFNTIFLVRIYQISLHSIRYEIGEFLKKINKRSVIYLFLKHLSKALVWLK